jgi:hypothetical protein
MEQKKVEENCIVKILELVRLSKCNLNYLSRKKRQAGHAARMGQERV